jgi:hypothetical protein
MPVFEMYIERWFTISKGMLIIEPMMEIWTNGLWRVWRGVLESQTADGLRQMSQRVWQNTMKPLSRLLNRHTAPREFLARTTGEDLRWEVVGIILSIVGLLVSPQIHVFVIAVLIVFPTGSDAPR